MNRSRKRKYLFTAALVATLALSILTVLVWDARAAKKRELKYQAAMAMYSKEFPVGASRKDVENSLNSKRVQFGQICCLREKSAFADLIKIGEEGHPWYCTEQGVYVELDFAALGGVPSDPLVRKADTDTLVGVTIFPWLQGCL